MRKLIDGSLSPEGFTFTELLVAMNLIVVAVLGLSLTTVAVIRGNKVNDAFAAATNLAHDKMEELKASTHLEIEDRCPEGGDHEITNLGASGGQFDRCWTISPSGLGARLRQVDVTVSWEDSEPHKVSLSSLIYIDEAF